MPLMPLRIATLIVSLCLFSLKKSQAQIVLSEILPASTSLFVEVEDFGALVNETSLLDWSSLIHFELGEGQEVDLDGVIKRVQLGIFESDRRWEFVASIELLDVPDNFFNLLEPHFKKFGFKVEVNQEKIISSSDYFGVHFEITNEHIFIGTNGSSSSLRQPKTLLTNRKFERVSNWWSSFNNPDVRLFVDSSRLLTRVATKYFGVKTVNFFKHIGVFEIIAFGSVLNLESDKNEKWSLEGIVYTSEPRSKIWNLLKLKEIRSLPVAPFVSSDTDFFAQCSIDASNLQELISLVTGPDSMAMEESDQNQILSATIDILPPTVYLYSLKDDLSKFSGEISWFSRNRISTSGSRKIRIPDTGVIFGAKNARGLHQQIQNSLQDRYEPRTYSGFEYFVQNSISFERVSNRLKELEKINPVQFTGVSQLEIPRPSEFTLDDWYASFVSEKQCRKSIDTIFSEKEQLRFSKSFQNSRDRLLAKMPKAGICCHWNSDAFRERIQDRMSEKIESTELAYHNQHPIWLYLKKPRPKKKAVSKQTAPIESIAPICFGVEETRFGYRFTLFQISEAD